MEIGASPIAWPHAPARVAKTPGGAGSTAPRAFSLPPRCLGLLLLPDHLLFGWCDELYGKITCRSQCNPVNLPQPLFEPPLVYAPELVEHDL